MSIQIFLQIVILPFLILRPHDSYTLCRLFQLPHCSYVNALLLLSYWTYLKIPTLDRNFHLKFMSNCAYFRFFLEIEYGIKISNYIKTLIKNRKLNCFTIFRLHVPVKIIDSVGGVNHPLWIDINAESPWILWFHRQSAHEKSHTEK